MEDRINEKVSAAPNFAVPFKSLHELVEYMSEQVQNPVTIEAQNFELIAYSANYNDFDVARRETILGKKVPSHIVEQLKQKGYVNKLESTFDPVRFPAIEEVGLSQRVAVPIVESGTLMGHIWIQETNRELTQRDFSFLREMAQIAAEIIIRNNEIRKSKNLAKDQFLLKIIQGEYSNERLIKLEADLAGFSLPHLYSVVVFDYPSAIHHEKLKGFIKVFCLYAGKTTYWIEKQQQIIIIVGSPSFIEGSSTKLAVDLVHNVLKKFGEANATGLHIGIGKEYHEISKAKGSYFEAMEVINLAKTLKKGWNEFPLTYQNLGIYRLLSAIHEKNKQDHYTNQNLSKLTLHDQENNSELIYTLEIFLKNNCKMKETAEELHIHPNTLNYRIKKIYELTNVNLDDINERVILYIDLLLYRLNLMN
jgi:DNA-binding PucR family transcriptional regulator